MSLRSMTGYGRARGEVAGVGLAVEVKTVNHKGLDIKVGVPPALAPLESRILQLVRSHMKRGRVDVRIRLDELDTSNRPIPSIDMEAVRGIHAQLQKVRTELGIVQEVGLSHLLSVRDVVWIDPRDKLTPDASWPQLKTLLLEALEANVAERDREGAVLYEDLSGRLLAIRTHLDGIQKEWPKIRDTHLDRIRDRVNEVHKRYELGEIPEERLMQEVVLVADRGDISEELTRARAHVDMLLALIKSHDPATAPVGKRLDFYFQELVREANTTGSKSHSAVIAAHVAEMRSEIDRLREQVLNVA